MHFCIGFVGISYDENYKHRKFSKEIKIDMDVLINNHVKYIFNDMKSKNHTFDVVISTNVIHLEKYIECIDFKWIDTSASSLHEREKNVMEFCMSQTYDGCFIIRCDLIMNSYISFMNIDYNKFNFPFKQVIYKRWKQLKFKRVPNYNLNEVGGGMYYIPKRLFNTSFNAFDKIIPNDRIHSLNDYFNDKDIHFISNRRYQSNTDVMKNPLFEFQRSSFNQKLNPNISDDFIREFITIYGENKSLNPEMEKCIRIIDNIKIRHN